MFVNIFSNLSSIDTKAQHHINIVFTHFFFQIDHREIPNSGLLLGIFFNATLDVRGTVDIHHSFTLTELKPQTVYEIYISAENVAGEGKSTRVLAVTDNFKSMC